MFLSCFHLVPFSVAVTSATSAELVAVSSIGAYDIYKKYFRPTAGAQELLRVDQISILVYGVFMGVLGLIWFYSKRLFTINVVNTASSYGRS